MELSVYLCALRGEGFSPRPLRASLSALSGQNLLASSVPSVVIELSLRQMVLYKQNVHAKKNYPAFFLTFVPMRNSFLTVPVGSRFIWSYNSVTASKNPAMAASLSRV